MVYARGSSTERLVPRQKGGLGTIQVDLAGKPRTEQCVSVAAVSASRQARAVVMGVDVETKKPGDGKDVLLCQLKALKLITKLCTTRGA